MTRGRFSDYVARLVDQAPRLSADTEATLRQLLAPSTPSTPSTPRPEHAVVTPTERTTLDAQRRPAA